MILIKVTIYQVFAMLYLMNYQKHLTIQLKNVKIVECTLFQYPDGRRTLEEMDCDFDQCPNHIDCIIAKAAREMERPETENTPD